jgi:ABC-type Zn uptake system ZnuABC Zn-binding protein ZnuA
MNRPKMALLAAGIAVIVVVAVVVTKSAPKPVGQLPAGERRTVLCTTFPIFQITRNVARDREGVEVQLMLPSQLGCPHDYALTPQDVKKLVKADVLVVNGLGLEEFLGAPVKKVNADLTIIDSSAGIKELLEYADEDDDGGDHEGEEKGHDAGGEHQGEHPFEWAGAFKLEPGVYRWSFAKVDGAYADPAMKMLFMASAAEHPIEATEEKAAALFEKDAGALAHGGRLRPGVVHALQFDAERDISAFEIKIDKEGTYVFFTEHMPYEFEAKEHFLKTAAGDDVEPIAEEPAHGHGHHHHHEGANPHLFASPRMAAKLAMNIAAELSRADPEGTAVYSKNAQAYANTLNELADEMATLGKKLKNNRIVQPHGIFDYLARDMGLEAIAVMQAHGQEPSAAEMIELVKTIREKKAGAVFTEPQYPEKVGNALSREAGVPVAMLDPVASGPENAPLDHYERVMRKNMKTLEATLGVQ